MANDMMVKELDQVVVRFSGDSGDGMQLAGNIFSTVSATVGNDISTFPDYPADIRAPQGSLTGVSGFQVHIGASKVFTPGDKCDVLVAMNAAARKNGPRQSICMLLRFMYEINTVAVQQQHTIMLVTAKNRSVFFTNIFSSLLGCILIIYFLHEFALFFYFVLYFYI